MEEIIRGRNPVIEAIKAGRPINKILIARGSQGSIIKILALAKEQHIPVREVERKFMDQAAGGSNHQGVIAYTAAKDYVEIEDIFSLAQKRGQPPFLLVLDSLEDPHNFGAILRTAEACGVHGVIIPKQRAVGMTGTVAKVSAGAWEHVAIARVTNLTRAILELKERGCWVTGAVPTAQTYYFQQDLTGPVAVVIGSEGKGVSRLVQENCDFLIKIPMLGQINSLNASVAAAVIMFEVVKQRLTLMKG